MALEQKSKLMRDGRSWLCSRTRSLKSEDAGLPARTDAATREAKDRENDWLARCVCLVVDLNSNELSLFWGNSFDFQYLSILVSIIVDLRTI
jgi:hypothetical protein